MLILILFIVPISLEVSIRVIVIFLLISEFREAFHVFDSDGSGSISSDEMGTVMRSLGQNPTEQDVKDLVEEIDINGKNVPPPPGR